jgi:DEAD/DEAH box helicase domain-containing protein
VDYDYYTIPERNTTIEAFNPRQQEVFSRYSKTFGDLNLRQEVSGYRKVRWQTGETVGHGEVHLPPSFLETKGCWLGIGTELVNSLRAENLWTADANNYGPGWDALKRSILKRDGFRCRACGTSGDESTLHVHHIQPFKNIESLELANRPSNW